MRSFWESPIANGAEAILPPALREQVFGRLRAIHAPEPWLAMVAGKVELDEATERRMLGESLPPVLRLMA